MATMEYSVHLGAEESHNVLVEINEYPEPDFTEFSTLRIRIGDANMLVYFTGKQHEASVVAAVLGDKLSNAVSQVVEKQEEEIPIRPKANRLSL